MCVPHGIFALLVPGLGGRKEGLPSRGLRGAVLGQLPPAPFPTPLSHSYFPKS